MQKKSLILPILIAVIVIIAVILAVRDSRNNSTPNTDTNSATSTPSGFATSTATLYTHPTAGYSLLIPENWVATELSVDPAFPRTISTTYAPKGSVPSDRIFSYDIIVSPTSDSYQRFLDRTGRQPTSQDLVDAHIESLSTELEDFQLMSTSTQTIGGQQVYMITAMWLEGRVTASKYFIFTREKIYSIGMLSLTPWWDLNSQTFVSMTQSFKVQ